MIKAYANGFLLASLSDGTFTGRRHIALMVTSSYNEYNVDIRFDNFTISPLSCGPEGAPENEMNAGANGFEMGAPDVFDSFLPRETHLGS
jgi:hypothetical protein